MPLQGQGGVGFAASCDGDDQPGTKRVVLWGDSHAAHLGPGLDELSRRDNFKLAQYSSAGCPPVVPFVSDRQKECFEINELVLRKIAELKPDTVIMAGRWEIYDGKGFGRSIRTQFATPSHA